MSEESELYAVASRSDKKTIQFAAKFGEINHYESYEELVLDPNVDIVYNATPYTFHFDHTMMCFKNSKPLLCKKPMGTNRYEVESMINETKAQNIFLMEAMWTRFIPGTEQVLQLVEGD